MSANVHRRNLNSSQKAMIYALLHPEGEKGGRGNKLSQDYEGLGDLTRGERNSISKYRYILKHAPELVDLIKDGHPDYPLTVAYEEAQAIANY